ncbi:Urocanate hydratase [Acipenser ruthenus]|uniref:Urocanate hydratase n=1 Tax=Acipenser ruthenus TaxID=7906 RepID=A0A444UZ79_ACIRT|nr:Urocanate hydratase [Acipenser ruthenus]
MQFLCEMTEEQTLVMYSGHPVGLFPSHRDAPRVVITNGMLTVLNAGRRYLGSSDLGGKVFVTAGLGGMSGAQAKAAVIAGCIGVIAEVDQAPLKKRHEQGWLMEITSDLDRCIQRIRAYPINSYPCKTKQAAAVMLMIMNNLDPCVAQFPQELVTYGGNGQVFSNWAQLYKAGALHLMTLLYKALQRGRPASDVVCRSVYMVNTVHTFIIDHTSYICFVFLMHSGLLVVTQSNQPACRP